MTALPSPLPDFLFAYVGLPDASFQWRQTGTRAYSPEVTLHEFLFISQTWQGIAWTHPLQLFVPANVEYADTVLLYITAGVNASEMDMGAFMASASGMAVAILYDIPNQPLFGELYEDGLIAHTFVQFLETGDATWPLLFPMVKSAVRAMDVLQQFRAGQSPSFTPYRNFFVTGASKRGWTTWLTAVADDRVKAILPMVYDNLNLPAQMPHQTEVAGDYSASIKDYTELDLPAKMQTPRGQQLAQMIDPYTYRERLTLPKLILNGTNDPYWMTDALNLYWPGIVGPKHVLYVPNTGHSLADPARLFRTMTAFLKASACGDSLPTPELHVEESHGYLRCISGMPADAARLWVAGSFTQDFRMSRWQASALERRSGTFTGMVELPETGYAAVFGEFDFQYAGEPYSLSTPIHIASR